MEVISTLELVQRLVGNNEVRISDHGWNKLETDDISLRDVIAGLAEAVVVEDYPDAGRGPSVLVLQQDPTYKPVHILWGYPKAIGLQRCSSRPIALIQANGTKIF